MSYTAANIKVLKKEDIESRFDWTRVAPLAQQYKCSEQFISNGFEVCYRLGLSIEYFIDHHLAKTKHSDSVPEFLAVYKELLKELHRGLK